jgi:F0F1-type ATP synthase membrane subunit b/b'
VPRPKKLVALVTAAALCLPIAACGDDDDVDQARKDIREQAEEIGGKLDDLSKQDLREALRDAENTAENGSGDAKREARQLERKIKRELNSRD